MKKTDILLLLLSLLLYTQISFARQFQSLESIHASVMEYLVSKANITAEHEITVNSLDKRLKLPQCSIPLEVFSANEVFKGNRISVGVRCADEKAWSIYTTANIKEFKDILVVAQTIPRGTLISRKLLTSARREVSKLRRGYYIDFSQVMNKQASRNLAPGTILHAGLLKEPKIVRRGEKVIILASSKSFEIKMTGLALMDGLKGQRIRVKNEKSKRIIEATVVEIGLVSVDF
jgi:flagellar basal body P-ring formation protein FlgA